MTGEPFGDFVQPFQLEGRPLRGRLVRLETALAGLLDGHDYPEPVASLVAEASALTAALASGLKFDGVFSLQLQGDGPVGLILVDVTSGGFLRAYARVAAERLDDTVSDCKAGVDRLVGSGMMAFTVDQGPETDRYQGIVALGGRTLADCARSYFRQSEQLETLIQLATSNLPSTGASRRAAALMVQRMPERSAGSAEDDDDWHRVGVLMGSLTQSELLDPTLAPGDLLYRLFHEDGVRVYRRRPLGFRCRCSRQRVERMLVALPEDDLMALADDRRVTVTCEFCKAAYVFGLRDLKALRPSPA